MIQNIKVDTIYYLTNSDFEMEFNLCGCCKMRLLTDKAENAKNFVGLLSRAVSRSQVIICCGKLFGNDGLIRIVAQAVKKPLTTVDNASYGIADSNEINIIEGSVPLVNSDGCFCGCIAESGPQSIILLTDNKGIRKTVMKQLIHPYIEELSIIRNTENEPTTESEESADTLTKTNEEENLEALTEQENLSEGSETDDNSEAELSLEQSDIEDQALESNEELLSENGGEQELSLEQSGNEDIAETPAQEETAQVDEGEHQALDEALDTAEADLQADENNSDTGDSTPISDFIVGESEENEEPQMFMDPTEINSGFELYLEPERVKYSKKSHYALNYIPSEQDKEFISESEDSEFFDSEEKKVLSLPILIIAIVLLIALATLAYLLVFIPMRSDYVFSEYIKNIFSVAVNLKPLI